MAAGIRRFAVKDSDKKKQAPEQGDGNEEMYGSGGSDDHSETREMLRRVHRQMITRKRRVRIYSYSGIAAAVLTGLFLFFQLRPGPDPQSLYDTYYKTWQFEVRRSVESNPGLYSRAKSAYMAGDYSGSAEMCRTMLVTRPPEPEIHLLLGLNLMELDSIQGAIQQFKAAATFPMDKRQTSRRWHGQSRPLARRRRSCSSSARRASGCSDRRRCCAPRCARPREPGRCSCRCRRCLDSPSRDAPRAPCSGWSRTPGGAWCDG